MSAVHTTPPRPPHRPRPPQLRCCAGSPAARSPPPRSPSPRSPSGRPPRPTRRAPTASSSARPSPSSTTADTHRRGRRRAGRAPTPPRATRATTPATPSPTRSPTRRTRSPAPPTASSARARPTTPSRPTSTRPSSTSPSTTSPARPTTSAPPAPRSSRRSGTATRPAVDRLILDDPRGDQMSTGTAPYARRWQALIVLAVSLLVVSVGNTILNVALPTIQDELDASSSELQWIVDGYLLVFAGPAARRRQPRRPLRPPARAARRALVTFGLGSVLAALARQHDRADRVAGADGHRRRGDHADDAVDHHQHLPRPRAAQGDRDLGRRGGAGRRDRARSPAAG